MGLNNATQRCARCGGEYMFAHVCPRPPWPNRPEPGPEESPIVKFAREIRADKEREAPGFHDVTPLSMCRHPEHGMPMHLHIPAGKKYVHYCPSCGHKSVAFGSTASL